MTIDMSQFLQTFYEESFEGLDIMENSLLSLDVGQADVEVVNTIFRAAHSIKGGSATFGLTDIASFTHVLETLLDEMRDGRRDVTQEAVNLLLQSVDVLRDMLKAQQDDADYDRDNAKSLQEQLEALLHGDAGVSDSSATTDVSAANGAASGGSWTISFRPHENLLQTGNDVVLMLREISALGDYDVSVDVSNIPPLEDMDPELSYMSWEISLNGDVTEAQIREVFEWVDDECDLKITAVDNNTSKVAAEGAQAAGKPGQKRAAQSSSTEASSIRVGVDKVDAIIDMVGELVITQSMLTELGKDFEMTRIHQLQEGLQELERNTRELQENVMRIRMLPISFVFNRFPRLAHDLSQKLGKNIELKMSGEQTELDKTVMEKIGDPMVHLVRNSLDHGIEMPEERKQSGKPETGVVHLNAYHKGGNIVIEITDDGAGLNTQKILDKARAQGLVGDDETPSEDKINELIFHPGFSTADVVSDVSGRGVGMDVVKRNILALGGSVDVVSKQGEGSTFTIRLPLTLAILDGQLVRVGGQTYIIPLISIIESTQAKPEQINAIAGSAELYRLREEYIPVLRLYESFGLTPDTTNLTEGLLVVVEGDGQKAGLFVDDLLGQQQVVIKSLESNFKRIEGISGATILGDGTVALIVDIPGLIRFSHDGTPKADLHLVSSKKTQAA